MSSPIEPSDTVYAVAFSPDGDYLVTAGDDGQARIWDTTSGEEAGPTAQHSDKTYDVAVGPLEWKYLATASADSTAAVWDLPRSSKAETHNHDDKVYGVAFSPDGKYLATASADGTARQWEVFPEAVSNVSSQQTAPPTPAPRPDPERPPAAGPEPVAPDEDDIPHDGTVVPCYLDPVCSSEQARIQSEFTAEIESARANKQPVPQSVHDMCRHAVQSKTPLPQICRSLGG